MYNTPETKLMMNDVELERVCDINFLGVIIDGELWWEPRINYVKAKRMNTNCVIISS